MSVVNQHRAIYSKGQTSTWLNYSTERIFIDKSLPTTIKHLVLFNADFTNLRLKKSFQLWAILECPW